MLIDKLKTSWSDLLAESEIDRQTGEVIFQDLIDTYSTCDRYYHNLEHIQHLLNLLTEVKDCCECWTGLQWAVWFHDYIYILQAQDNELKSALYAEDILIKFNLNSDIIYLVKQIIISTHKHQPLIQSIDNLVFLDVDLAILGTTKERYQEYAGKIRQEYGYLSDLDYQQGRRRVLSKFISRPRIYYTDYFYHKFEQQARNNIQTEISNK